MARIARGAVVALVLAMVGACGDDDSGERGGGGGSLGSLTEAVATVPLEELGEGATIAWADLDAASDAAGIDRPEAGDLAGLAAWAMAMTNDVDALVSLPLPDTLQPQRLQQLDEFEAELGWSIVDVGAYVELHHPPTRFFVGTGDLGLDGDGVRDLGDGLHTAGEGEDQATRLDDVTAARPLGRPLRLAESGDLLAASLRTEPLQRWVDGTGDRLTDHAGIAAVAAALDDAGAVSAVLHASPTEGPWAYDVVGIGWSIVGGDPVISIAFHLTATDDDRAVSAFEEAIEEGVTLRGQPVRDLLELDSVAVEDGVLVATVSPGPDGNVHVPFRMLTMRDVPFIATSGR